MARTVRQRMTAARTLLRALAPQPTFRGPAPRRPVLEALEDRTLLAATISGSVFNDLNRDGVRAAADPAQPGIIAYLDAGTHQAFDGTQQFVVIDGTGAYSFANLAAGTYAVGIVAPDGSTLTSPAAGFRMVTLGASDVTGVDFGVAGVNEAVTNAASVQQMPSVAVNPKDASHIVMAYMDYGLLTTGYAGIGVAVSHNGGTTWTHSAVPLPAGFDQAAGQPVAQFDANGNVYVSFMAATFLGGKPGVIYDPSTVAGVAQRTLGMTANNGIFVARSSDGGTTWSQPASVASNTYTGTRVPFETLPDMAIDQTCGAIYVTWTRFYPAGLFPNPDAGRAVTGGTDVMLAVSTDGGLTFSTRLRSNGTVNYSTIRDPLVGGRSDAAQGAGFSTISRVTVGAAGDVYVSMVASNRFAVFYSNDGGVTFRNPVPDTTNPDSAGYPFGIDSDQYTAVYTTGAGSASFIPAPTLANNSFRTLSVRAIAADPTRAGTVYAVESMQIISPSGTTIDRGEIGFSRSTDFGVTWTRLFTVGGDAGNRNELPASLQFRYRSVLNDDDDGRFTGFDTTPQDEVISGQALPQLTVDANGNIAVIWYDTRRDPNNTLLDVYGTVSTDGGQTFTSNYRVTGSNFNANTGSFTDARGAQNFYLGDRIGLAASGGTIYAAWTGTLAGNQDVYFSSYALNPSPPPFNDRFEANDTPQTATNLGKITAARLLPRLTLVAGEQDWFLLQAGATGQLNVTASAPVGGAGLTLELWDATGTTRLATGTDLLQGGVVVGRQVLFNSVSNQSYLVRVSGQATPTYSLALQSLTADLGTDVEGAVGGSVAAGAQALYSLVTPVSGSLEVNLTPTGTVTGKLQVQVLGADGVTILAAGDQAGHISLPVNANQPVLLQVSGVNTASVLVNGAPTVLALGTPGTAVTFSTPLNQQAALQVDGASPLKVRVSLLNSAGAVTSTQDMTLVPGSPVTLTGLAVGGGFRIQALDPAATGSYTLGFTNLDAFETPQNGSVFYPSGSSSSSLASGDVNGDHILDLITTSTQGGDTVSVLLGNSDGTFQAPRQFAVGSGQAAVSAREPVLGDFTGDHIPDIAVPNYFSADVSLLVGRGDGTFAPQRTFDAVYKANSLVAGDFNGDGNLDLAVLDRDTGNARLAVLLGNGDGTFQPPRLTEVEFARGDASPVRVGDVNGDLKLDLLVFSANDAQFQVLLGKGDGTFTVGQAFAAGETLFEAQLADVNGDTRLDAIIGGGNTARVFVALGNGDGTFQPLQAFNTATARPGDNVGVIGLTVANFSSTGGRPDIVVTTRSRSGSDAPQVWLLPAGTPGSGPLFGAARLLGTAPEAGKVVVGDFDRDGDNDLALTESGGVRVLYTGDLSLSPNTTQATARNLGTVAHYVGQPQAIVTGFTDAWYRLTVPTEAAAGAGDQVVDFSALFQHVQGAGLQMEVRDATGTNVLCSGSRFRLRVAQGAELLVHVFALPACTGVARGEGVYTLDIDVLPQVVSVEAQSLVAGGPANTLVLTIQGDRLDADAAEVLANYKVTWLGADGLAGTADDEVIPLGVVGDGPKVVYAGGVNTVVSTGRQFPTAVRQTVTLYFADPLPTGSYRIQVKGLRAAAFNAGEADVLAPGFSGQSLVSIVGGNVVEGSDRKVANLVPALGTTDLTNFGQGSAFLSQLHANLGAQLLALQNAVGDGATITPALNEQIVAATAPGVGNTSFMFLWFDPVSIDVADPNGDRAVVDLKTNTVSNSQSRTFIAAGGNVEVVVLAGVSGTYTINLSDVQATARAGAVIAEGGQIRTVALTDAMRGGERSFTFSFGSPETTGVGLGATTAAFSASTDTSLTSLQSASRALLAGEAAGGVTVSAAEVNTLSSLFASLAVSAQAGALNAASGGGEEEAARPLDRFLANARVLIDQVLVLLERASAATPPKVGAFSEPVALVAGAWWKALEAKGATPGAGAGGKGSFASLLLQAAKALVDKLSAERAKTPAPSKPGGTPPATAPKTSAEDAPTGDPARQAPPEDGEQAEEPGVTLAPVEFWKDYSAIALTAVAASGLALRRPDEKRRHGRPEAGSKPRRGGR